MLGPESGGVELRAAPPAPILLVGLQGSGKTTTAAKLAVRLRDRENKKTLMASLDVQRPAAQEQLAILGRQADIDTLPIVAGEWPAMIAARALETARKGGYDALILDTAGRLHVDDALMAEAAQVRDLTKPAETLLVADAMTGQDAVNVAKSFHERVGLTGIILTRVDGDARGGAALSMRAVTGCPIRLIGVGEKLDALEPFHPERVASRILGMGDIVSLVEKAVETAEEEEAKKLAENFEKGRFDFDALASQLKQIRRMGGMGGILGMMPGVAKIKAQLANAKIDEKMIVRQEAIISSMTKQERRRPDLIKASRKRRIAEGSGTTVQEVNRLMKQQMEMERVMKQAKKLGQKGLMRHGIPGLTGPR
jgi:signal recognition particle subunit SRP54